MWIANPPKTANGLQIRWNRGALKERHQFSPGREPWVTSRHPKTSSEGAKQLDFGVAPSALRFSTSC